MGSGEGNEGSEERRKRSGIGGRVLERPEGAEIIGIRGKRGEKGDIIAWQPNVYGHFLLVWMSFGGKC